MEYKEAEHSESKLSKLIYELSIRSKKAESELILMGQTIYNEISLIRIDKTLSENEKSSKLYELYEKKIANYNETNLEEDLLDAGVALFNSVVVLDEDLIDLRKLRLKSLIDLSQHEFIGIKERRHASLLKAKALLEEVVILIEKDHNFHQAFLNLEEIKKIDDNYKILSGKLKDAFVVNALEIYRLQGETEKHELLLSEIENKVGVIDPYIAWYLILQLIKAKKFTEKCFMRLSDLRYEYFFDWLESCEFNSYSKEDIESLRKKIHKYLLGERLKTMALDEERDKDDFSLLIKSFKEEHEEDAAEIVCSVTVEKGIKDKDPVLTMNGIQSYENLEKTHRGIEFHTAESRIKYHLAFTDFTSPEERKKAKEDLFSSLGVIERSLGEEPIKIFTRMIDTPELTQVYYRERLDDFVSNEEKQKMIDSLDEIKQSAYLRDIAALMLLLYGKDGMSPKKILDKAVSEQEYSYKKRKEMEFLSITEEESPIPIKKALEDYYEIEILHFSDSILKDVNKSSDLFVNFALKVHQDQGESYLVHTEEIDEKVIVLIGFPTKNGVFVLEEKDKYLKSHVIKFIRGKLGGEELDIDAITASIVVE